MVHEILAIILAKRALHVLIDLSELLVLRDFAEPVVALQQELVDHLFVLAKGELRRDISRGNSAQGRHLVDVAHDLSLLRREHIQVIGQEGVRFVVDGANSGEDAHTIHVAFL